MTTSWDEAAKRLSDGDIGVVPTDTLYGVVGSAMKPQVVERIYELRQRELDKPLIVLLADAADLAKFQIEVDDRTNNLLKKVWPGPVSVIMSAPAPELAYIHRGTNSIAFRVPSKPELHELLKHTGPLVAPSANLAGEEPARTVGEARQYFEDKVFYLDEGRLDGHASALVDARGPVPRVLRTAPGFKVSE